MSAVARMRMWPTNSSSLSKKMVENLKCFPSLTLPQPFWCSSASLSPSTTTRSSIRNAPSTTFSAATTSTEAFPPPLSGLEVEDDVIMGYIFGKKKATQVAHSLWKHVVRKGDLVIDATCGNGHDTLALVNLVADNTTRGGRVYAMDIQKSALETTSLLLDQSLTPDQVGCIQLRLPSRRTEDNYYEVANNITCIRGCQENPGTWGTHQHSGLCGPFRWKGRV